MPTEHTSFLIAQSERIVDLQEALLQTRSDMDSTASDHDLNQVYSELESIGDEVVGLLSHLKEDDWTFAQFMLGSICSTLELWTHAEQAYALALNYWPDHIGLLNEMAHCQCELGHYERAIDYYQQSLTKGGDDPDIHYNIAMAFAYWGAYAKATLHTITALARYPHHKNLQELLAILDAHSAQTAIEAMDQTD